MKKILLIVFVFITTTFFSQKPYDNALGFRFGLANGVTFKHFFNDNVAFEGLLSSRWRGLQITGLAEFGHHNIGDNFDWYYGVGGHIGFFNGYKNHPWGKEGSSYTVIGADGIIGVEYTFDFPLNLSLDYKPAFNFIGYSGFWGDTFALSARFIF